MVWTKARGGKPKNHNMKIDTNTPIAALCDQLREWSGYNGKDAAELLDEVADRLELLAGENEDLRSERRCWKGAAYSIAADILKAKEDKP